MYVPGGSMKKKFLAFLFSICFALPCAIFLAGCNSSGGPTLNGYEVYINGQKTNEYTCYVGEEAITWEDVVIKSNWTDASKNAVVPLTDFDLSVKWKIGRAHV